MRLRGSRVDSAWVEKNSAPRDAQPKVVRAWVLFPLAAGPTHALFRWGYGSPYGCATRCLFCVDFACVQRSVLGGRLLLDLDRSERVARKNSSPAGMIRSGRGAVLPIHQSVSVNRRRETTLVRLRGAQKSFVIKIEGLH